MLAFGRYGISDDWSVGGYVQYQEQLSIFGMIQQWGTSLGYLTLDIAYSDDQFSGTGWATAFEWSSDANYLRLKRSLIVT